MSGVQLERVNKEKLERALGSIRKDIASLHRDLAGAEGNKKKWIFVIMWLVSAHVLHDFFQLGNLSALLVSAIVVFLYGILDGQRIRRNAFHQLKEPLEPTFDTKVDLS